MRNASLDLNINMDFKAVSWASPDYTTRAPMPRWLLPLCFCSAIGTLMLPPSPYRKFVALPVLLGSMAILPMYTTGDLTMDYEHMICVWQLLFRYMDLLWWSRPEENFRRVPRKWKEDDGRVEEEGKPEDLVGRAKWSATLFWNHRGVGWNWRIRSIPKGPLPGLSKTLFLKDIFFRILFTLLVTIYIASVLLSTDYYSSTEMIPDIYQDSHIRRTMINFANALILVTGMNAVYWIIAFPCVLFNITEPEDWPDLMTSPAEAYTVRRLWGVAYHQYYRRFFVGAGDAFTNLFSIPRHSLTSQTIHLITAFVMSAFLHHAGGIMIGKGSMGNYAFFLAQPAAIIFEDVAITLFSFLGYKLTRTAKAVGYAWVLLWLAFSLTPFTNGYIKSGYGRGVALYSNCGVDGYLPSLVMAGGSNSTTMGLLQALSYRGLFLAAAVAVLAVVRRMVIPGKRLVDMSLIGL